MSSSSDQCDDAKLLSDSVPFRVILATKAVICILGVVTTTLSLKFHGISWLANPNAKAIFIFHLAWAILVPFFYAFVFGYDFIRLSSSFDDPCDYTIPATISLNLRIIPVVGLLSQTHTMCSFAIERTISTIYPVEYERIKSRIFGVCLGIGSCILSMAECYGFIYPNVNWNDRLFTSAVKTRENSESYQSLLSIYLCEEIFTAVLFTIVLITNQIQFSKLSEHQKLGGKYQVIENRKIIHALLPCFCIHFLLNVISTFGLRLYPVYFPTYHSTSATIWVEIFSQAQLYSLLMPLVIWFRLKFCRPTVVITSNLEFNAYFEQLGDWFHPTERRIK